MVKNQLDVPEIRFVVHVAENLLALGFADEAVLPFFNLEVQLDRTLERVLRPQVCLAIRL